MTRSGNACSFERRQWSVTAPRGVVLTTCFVAAIVALSSSARGDHTLAVSAGVANTLQPTPITVSMTSDDALTGYILAVAYDTALVSVTDISLAGTVADGIAEGVFAEVFEIQGGFTLGVILDFEAPFDGQTIPPAPDPVPVAVFTLSLDTVENSIVVVPLDPVDGVLNNPPVDNVLLVSGGNPIGVAEGLILGSGSLTIDLLFMDSLTIEPFTIPADEQGEGRVLLSNPSGPVTGFTLAIDHGDELTLEEITAVGTVTEAFGAEFVSGQVFPDGGVVSVVMDLVPPFDGQSIPVGVDAHIMSFVYSCPDAPVIPDPAITVPITFDANPTELDYTGFSLQPVLVDGAATCEPVAPPVPPNTVFFSGVLDEAGLDVLDVFGNAGGEVSFGFYYSDPDDEIGGFQIAATCDCLLALVEGTFSIDGTELEEVGAEFVTTSIDNDATDGDGCELVIGILLDALPPFDAQTVPPSVNPRKIGDITMVIDPGAAVGSCLPVMFTDGINAAGAVPLSNLVIVGTASVEGFALEGGNVCVVEDTPFVRGDCNTDGLINIVDGVFLLEHLFGGGAIGGCAEACNFNGVSGLGLPDAVFGFNFLFAGGANPPAPYPGCGTQTAADCDEYLVCP